MNQTLSTKLLAVFPIAVFACLFAYLSIESSTFLSLGTFELILKQAVPTVIVSLGLAAVVIAGGDDVVAGGAVFTLKPAVPLHLEVGVLWNDAHALGCAWR